MLPSQHLPKPAAGDRGPRSDQCHGGVRLQGWLPRPTRSLSLLSAQLSSSSGATENPSGFPWFAGLQQFSLTTLRVFKKTSPQQKAIAS